LFARTSGHILYGRDKGGDENFHLWCAALDESEPSGLTQYGAVTFRWIGAHRRDRHLIAIGLHDRDARRHDLYELDIDSGRRRLLHENVSKIAEYIVDQELNLRMAMRARARRRSPRPCPRWARDDLASDPAAQ
jgi:hypothetical protein